MAIVDVEPLVMSFVSREIWDLFETDREAFKRRVREHFALGMPQYEVVKFNPQKRIIWLRKKNL